MAQMQRLSSLSLSLLLPLAIDGVQSVCGWRWQEKVILVGNVTCGGCCSLFLSVKTRTHSKKKTFQENSKLAFVVQAMSCLSDLCHTRHLSEYHYR
jgi:uncharacterized membrane protein YsdA (DUF1294 family)